MAIAKAQPKPVVSPYAYSGNQAKVTVVKPPPKPASLKPVIQTAPVVKPVVKKTVAPPNALQSVGSDAAQGDGDNMVWNPGPNYGAALVGSPDFTDANAAYEENVRLSHDQRQRRIRAALINLGFQPGGADAKALEGIDPSTAELAQNNSASALAKLGLKRGTDRADLSAELAARGILNSGALRGGENMVQMSYDQGLLGATQNYLSEQDAALGDEANALATGQNTYTAAKAQAALAAAQNPLFTPTWQAGPQQPTLAPGQGTRPDQTPVLAKAPPLAVAQPKAPVKVVAKTPVKVVPKVVPKPVINTKKPLL